MRHPFITMGEMLYLICTYYESLFLFPSVLNTRPKLLRAARLNFLVSQIHKNEAVAKYETKIRFLSQIFLLFYLINYHKPPEICKYSLCLQTAGGYKLVLFHLNCMNHILALLKKKKALQRSSLFLRVFVPL